MLEIGGLGYPWGPAHKGKLGPLGGPQRTKEGEASLWNIGPWPAHEERPQGMKVKERDSTPKGALGGPSTKRCEYSGWALGAPALRRVGIMVGPWAPPVRGT